MVADLGLFLGRNVYGWFDTMGDLFVLEGNSAQGGLMIFIVAFFFVCLMLGILGSIFELIFWFTVLILLAMMLAT